MNKILFIGRPSAAIRCRPGGACWSADEKGRGRCFVRGFSLSFFEENQNHATFRTEFHCREDPGTAFSFFRAAFLC